MIHTVLLGLSFFFLIILDMLSYYYELYRPYYIAHLIELAILSKMQLFLKKSNAKKKSSRVKMNHKKKAQTKEDSTK